MKIEITEAWLKEHAIKEIGMDISAGVDRKTVRAKATKKPVRKPRISRPVVEPVAQGK
jgi:hypothetical protein